MFPTSASVRLLRKQLWRLDHSRLFGSSRQVFLRFSFSFLQKQAGPALLALWLCGRLFLLFGCVFASQTPLASGGATFFCLNFDVAPLPLSLRLAKTDSASFII
jgi:hypothetical protein